MAKVLLTTLNAKYIHLNLAIRILYDLNREKGDLDFHEFTIKNPSTEIASFCKEYDVICFSCYIWNITQTLEAAKEIKKVNPNCKILLGGPEVSYEWETVIVHEFIDYIIVGEGEIPFEEFILHYPNVSSVPNLVYKENEEIHFNKQSVQFDILKLANRNPYQYDSPEELYNKVCYIETSRGCPYKCEFCLASLDNKVRYLPIETIHANLLYLMNHGRVIKFLDRTFNIKKDFTLNLFDFILKNHSEKNVFQFEITADILHPDIIKYIQETIPRGLFRFEIGIQSVNKETNLAVSRKQNFDKTSSIILQLRDKVDMHLDLIVGLPLEYLDDVKYSFEQTFALHPPELQLGFLKFLKGTPVRLKHEEHDYIFDNNPPYQIIRSKYLSEEDLWNITIVENALEIFWNKGRTIHALKYVSQKYSIFDFFLGLGKHFLQSNEFHQYTLKDVFYIIMDYAKTQYPDDIILQELICMDYFIFNKIKPQDIFEYELSKQEKFEWIERLKLNHHLFRYTMFKVHFDIDAYLTSHEIITKESTVIIQYDGKNKGKIINTSIIEKAIA